ncbi:MAG: hypothetical protein AWU57_641 [Marinobacter sp. T13-3]|nr:MAG: hypothetical protein AWU57_641 [Marinobacter sp. T13-3]
MSSADLVRKVTAVNDILNRSSDIADSELVNLKRDNEPHSPKKIEESLSDLNAAGRELSIGVIGRVKAGKSSLINSLLFDGSTVLPKAATPMTAALTTINYGERLGAEVEFFSRSDIEQLKRKNQEHSAILDQKVKEKLDWVTARFKNSRKRDVAKPDVHKIEAQALRDVEVNHPSLAAASDLYKRISESGINADTLGSTRILEADSLSELKDELERYVGSAGDLMPFTKMLKLNLPDESLKHINVIDTPGLNDAVASREQRTYEMLNQCDVVFIVSPAGQFLNFQDLELASRLTRREGVREVFVVASQVDTQLHGDVRSTSNANLPKAMEKVRSILARQGEEVLRNQGNEVLKSIAGEQHQRLLLSSGICQTLLTQPESDWDDGARYVYEHLAEDYPDYFTDQREARAHLQQLSGRDDLQLKVSAAREQKGRIQANRAADYLSDQTTTFERYLNELIAYFGKLQQKINSADKEQVQSRLEELGKIKSKGEQAAKYVFEDKVHELDSLLSDQLKAISDDIFGGNREEIKASETKETESYRAKKDGVGNWVARQLWGGGFETRTREYIVVDAADVRESLEKLVGFVEDGINDTTGRILMKWRNGLQSELVRSIREVMGDKSDYLESDALMSACRRAVAEIGDFPSASLPDWPEELSSSEKKKGREAEEHISLAKEHYADLRNASRAHVKRLRSHLEALGAFQLEIYLFNALESDMEKQQQLVVHKELSLEKLGRIINDLEGLANE